MCVVNTISLFPYNTFANTMSPCLYHDSMSKPWVHVYTISPCLYLESLSNPCFHFYIMIYTVFRYTEIQITRIKKYLQIYWKYIYSNTEIKKYPIEEIQLAEVEKYKWQDYRNTKDFWIMRDSWMSPCLYHESLSNPCYIFYTMRNTVFRYTEIQITRKRKNQNHRNITCGFTEIQITVIQKYKILNWRYTTCRSAEIQITGIQK